MGIDPEQDDQGTRGLQRLEERRSPHRKSTVLAKDHDMSMSNSKRLPNPVPTSGATICVGFLLCGWKVKRCIRAKKLLHRMGAGNLPQLAELLKAFCGTEALAKVSVFPLSWPWCAGKSNRQKPVSVTEYVAGHKETNSPSVIAESGVKIHGKYSVNKILKEGLPSEGLAGVLGLQSGWRSIPHLTQSCLAMRNPQDSDHRHQPPGLLLVVSVGGQD